MNMGKSHIATVVREIKHCLEAELIYPALFMALSLPDMCGKEKWADLSGLRKSKERYMRWFDEYVDPHLNPLEHANVGYKPETRFGAKECYCLRCSLPHAGESDIGEEINVDHFCIELSSVRPSGCVMKIDCSLVPEKGKWRLAQIVFVKAIYVVQSILAGVADFQKGQDKITAGV